MPVKNLAKLKTVTVTVTDLLKVQLHGIMLMLAQEKKINMAILYIHNLILKTVLYNKRMNIDLHKEATLGTILMLDQNRN